ncbi:hypothetical protein COT42_04460 [Candidatus Saganbacteria bacterium CG08_land_8_20_14_0_20_45_16]|uniref:Uncharacterized protein n=1 Tax=Candidatus Saganbacteria bacterium CG08_land_8_20_14_0_20_45_16 TaxID=2014293 RepID=A0A2H0XXT9_UNCSA|nr:MAG: hypothetical protein COT42_04460 [Candidatus Saganbacteria bacterium CG08_land_8_20_14_0_20_45_16]
MENYYKENNADWRIGRFDLKRILPHLLPERRQEIFSGQLNVFVEATRRGIAENSFASSTNLSRTLMASLYFMEFDPSSRMQELAHELTLTLLADTESDYLIDNLTEVITTDSRLYTNLHYLSEDGSGLEIINQVIYQQMVEGYFDPSGFFRAYNQAIRHRPSSFHPTVKAARAEMELAGMVQALSLETAVANRVPASRITSIYQIPREVKFFPLSRSNRGSSSFGF